MRESANYKFNLPDKADQFNLDHWNQNTEKLDEKLKSIDDLTNNDLKTSLLNFIYPVGSLYWSSNPTNPSTLFGGTWKQIKDRFILAAGDTYTNGEIGGNATTTLTEANLPSHTHGLNNHTHSFTPSGSVKVTTNPTFSGTEVTSGGMSDNSTGTLHMYARIKNGYTESSAKTGAFKNSSIQNHYISGSGSCLSLETLNMNVAHTHAVTAKGSISGGAYSFTGTAGTTGAAGGNTTATGSGTAFSNMPPYVAKYCWERTA